MIFHPFFLPQKKGPHRLPPVRPFMKIRFVTQYGSYAAGEEVDLEPRIANKMLAGNLAELVTDDVPAPEPDDDECPDE